MNRKLFEYSYTLRKEKKKKDLKIFTAIVISIIVISVVMNFLVFPVRQNSSSMSPDLPCSSVVLVTPLVKTPGRGDVVFINPQGYVKNSLWTKVSNIFVYLFTARQINLKQSNAFPNTKPKIRRVVGLPGDTIYMKDYKIYVRPKGEKHFLTEFELSDRSYNIIYGKASSWDKDLGVSGNFDEIVVGSNQYFVLSDDRNAADDSRLWGAINQNRIGGKVLLCYFPFKTAKFLF